MDIATIIGLLGGAGLVLSAIFMGGSVGIFINVPGLLIVVGGAIATCFIKFSMKEVVGAIKVALKAFLVKVEPLENIIVDMVGYAKKAKKEGLIALEKETPKDEFVARALRYMADGYDETLIQDMLKRDIRLTIQRHTTGQAIFKGMGDSAPAFGMIGTLIGLVQMLANMSEPSSIGPAMAVALLTTLYGALMANLICIPLAEKLSMRSDEELKSKTLIVEAALAINQGLTPALMEESLKIFLAPRERGKVDTKNKKK